MDCPTVQSSLRSWLIGGLLGLASGCVQVTDPQPVRELPPNAHVRREDELPRRKPKVDELVAWGNLRAKVAREEPQHSPQERMQLRDYARRNYQQALELDPKYSAAYAGLGLLYQDMEDYERALETYDKGLKSKPRDANLWFQKGMCQARRKDWEPALKSLRSAWELDPEAPAYRNNLGFVLARADRYDESYAFFRQALGNEAKAHYNVARALHYADKDEESKNHLRLALKADPKMFSARELLAELETPSRPSNPVATVSLEEAGGNGP